MASCRDGRPGPTPSGPAPSCPAPSCPAPSFPAPSHGGTSIPPNRPSIRTPKRPRAATSARDDKNDDLLCPVCFNLIAEAHITRCGHTYCFGCISKAIEVQQRCPKCAAPLTAQQIFPNFLLNELIAKHKRLGLPRDSPSVEFADGLKDFVAAESQNLSLPDVNVMLEVLTQRKRLLEAESSASQNRLLLEFLGNLLKQKREQQARIAKEIAVIERDIDEVSAKLRDVHSKCPTLEDVERTAAGASASDQTAVDAMKREMIELIDNIGRKEDPCFAKRRRRMYAYFDDFAECYFSHRSKDVVFARDKTAKPASEPSAALDHFRESLVKFSTYNSLRVLSTLNYSSDLFNNSTIVSSIEFDKDNEFFAIAGVTKRIKVFEYAAVVKELVSVHYPCIEMVSKSKISCVSWHSYHKTTLASSDYEGTVAIWDASTAQRTKTYQEHQKRCWSVDFNGVDTRLIASGSDDARVKLYSLTEEHSVATLEAKANVCCVKFDPRSSHHLAFGCADHCVHYYDLRNMKEPVNVFKGHKKAVSYVKFLNSEEIVSASTDSQLKMWSINKPYCTRSFVGHLNEKNFVGLGTDGDYVACGSETNALFVYYKGLSKKLFSYQFEGLEGVLEEERREEDMNEFVSAVCWKQNSNVVVAANSRGLINILEAGNEVKAGKAFVFWGVDSTFQSVAVVGLGKKCEEADELEQICHEKEAVRIAASAGCRALDAVGVKTIQVEDLGDAESAAEGSLLGTWKFQEYKTEKHPPPQIHLFDPRGATEAAWQRGAIKADAQNVARLLADTPSNLLTPTILSERVLELLRPLGVAVTVRDRDWAERQRMGAFLSVAGGSAQPPRFVEASLEAGRGPPLVLVGKGVTFDSGGISLKPAAGMGEMRADMGGAASVVAALWGLARLGAAANVRALLPLAENMPSGTASRPGDVVTARNGKTICVDNTDAEGRLLLADALCYAADFAPGLVLDVATLTGAAKVALGNAATAVFSTSDRLYDGLRDAGAVTGDRVWRMPLWRHFSKQVTDNAAYDLNNVGSGKGGGSCTAAAFLREFAPPAAPWLHLDIAGVMGPQDDAPYLCKGMTGRPTRTLIEFVEARLREAGHGEGDVSR